MTRRTYSSGGVAGAAAILVSSLLGCGTELAPPPPTLQSLEPNTARSYEPTEALVHGTNFYGRIGGALNRREPLWMLNSWALSLGSTPVDPSDVERLDSATLAFTLPGLAAGTYDLHVTPPVGDPITLPKALTVVAGDLGECAGRVVDLTADRDNCGQCGQSCGALSCVGGSCVCPSGLTECAGICADLDSDPAHCGACSNGCGGGGLCEGGRCICPVGTVKCAGNCVDGQSDPRHCGGCGNACGAGATCRSGLCCGQGATNCGGACVDLLTSAVHCGACGNGCSGGKTCGGGMCACVTGATDCGGACVDLLSDAAHCGACGSACAFGESCWSGLCCGAGLTNCGGACVDLQSARAHCGGCGILCTGGKLCTGGSCGCPAGLSDCSGSCVDLQSDAAHCGGCGSACPVGESCLAGVCCAAGLTNCGGACVDLQTNASHCAGCGNTCPATWACTTGICGCPAGTSDCNGACVDLQTSDADCGACGNACPVNRTCAAGTCVCTAGTGCGGACVDLLTDASHCGACANRCPVGESCVSGICCDPSTIWYPDRDGDAYGDGAAGIQSCTQPAGHVADGTDCDDDPLLCGGGCFPGNAAADLCDGYDQDCLPATPDGSSEPGFGTACDGPDGDLCADDLFVCQGMVLVCSTGATETEDPATGQSCADGADNDCDGLADLAEPSCNGCLTGTYGASTGPAYDATLDEALPGINRGTEVLLEIGDRGGEKHAVIWVDMGSIPATATINLATLVLDPKSAGGPQRSVGVAPMTAAWNELETTWLNATQATPWSIPGGDYDGVAISDTQLVSDGAPFSLDVTPIVADWVAGLRANHGLIVLQTDTRNGSLEVYSKDHNNPRWPKIEVEFCTP